MMADLWRVLGEHGVKTIRQDHHDRMIALLSEMLAAQEKGGL